MAGDLWEAALNAHPDELAKLAGKKEGTREDRFVRLDRLQQHNYDLSKVMGTVLRQRYSFDSLKEARRAYSEAFPKGAIAVQAAISDRTLDALSLVRNLIVHKGGIVDKEFLERSPDLPQ